jgi:hypothetical protein
MLVIGVTLGINEAFFPRHVPEVKLESDRPVASGAPDSPSGRAKIVLSLILKRASASRPSGEWNDDDFDVCSCRTFHEERAIAFSYSTKV